MRIFGDAYASKIGLREPFILKEELDMDTSAMNFVPTCDLWDMCMYGAIRTLRYRHPLIKPTGSLAGKYTRTAPHRASSFSASVIRKNSAIMNTTSYLSRGHGFPDASGELYYGVPAGRSASSDRSYRTSTSLLPGDSTG